MLSGSFKDVARRISMAFCSIDSLSGITERPLRNPNITCSSSFFIFRFESNSIRTITLIKNCASSTFIPSKDKSYCRSISLIATLVSKAILVPFITDSPLICHRITEGSRLKLPKKHRNRFAVGVSGFFLCCLQGFFDCGVTASGQGRTFFCRRFCLYRSRSKSKNSPSRRDFMGYVDSQSVISRYFYSLCNGHGLNIA